MTLEQWCFEYSNVYYENMAYAHNTFLTKKNSSKVVE
jgi:hypothetical protein